MDGSECTKKLFDLAEHILAENYDIVCLQEINQLIESETVDQSDLDYYHPIAESPEIHTDNYAFLLVNYLEKHGRYYHWSWAYNHIGYDIYQEGVAILSKTAIDVEAKLISDTDDPGDYHTRRALIAQTFLKDKPITVVSLHMSWYEKGFDKEWRRLEKVLLPKKDNLILLGDFNNPSGEEGYQMILKSPLELFDSHKVARRVIGTHTILADIDGWEDSHQQLKVDYAFVSSTFRVISSEVTLDGGTEPIVSDHFGLKIKCDN